MYLDMEEIIDSLSIEDIKVILKSLGAETIQKIDKNTLRTNTICHNAFGGSLKLYYYHLPKKKFDKNGKENKGKLFHCYTGADKNCGDSFGVIELVLRAKRTKGTIFTFYQALNYIANITGKVITKDFNDENIIKRVDDWDWINKFNEENEQISSMRRYEPLNENILALFENFYHESWLDEGISKEVMQIFGIKFWSKTNQIIIPHRDISGNLIGVRGRCLNEEDLKAKRKYIPVIVDGKFLKHDLGDNFYGLFENLQTIKRIRKVIIYESEKSVLKNHMYFNDNDFSLAICGSNLTEMQIFILINVLKIEEVILALDKEYEYYDTFQSELYLRKLVTLLKPLYPYCKCSILMDKSKKGEVPLLMYKDAPVDRGKEVLLKLLEDKIIITEDDLKLLEKDINTD